MIALIDSDVHRYQIGSVTMPHPFVEGEFVPASRDYVCYLVDRAIEEIVNDIGASSYICALSGKGNFRNSIAIQQPYKGNRDPNSSRPMHYDTVGDHIRDNHPHVIVDGMEADDWLGITQRSNFGEYCIATRDKDLLTVPGWHYRFACGKAQPAIQMHWIEPIEATRFFFYQMLIGDETDNIPGCGKREYRPWGTAHTVVWGCGKKVKIPRMVLRRKGVGSAKAHSMLEELQTPQEMYDVVREAYRAVYGDADADTVMLEQARLLYIGQTPEKLFTWDVLGILTDTDKLVCNQQENV